MQDFIVYLLVGIVVVLLALVLLMFRSLISLKTNMDETKKQIEETGKNIEQNNLLNKQANEYLQASMAQNMESVSKNIVNSYASLNQTLDNKLQNSFNNINSYLQTLNKDLGEMKSVASGIDDVKKVLSNVKTRGILGEIQLGAILSEILAPGQYEENIATVPGSSERVEFAVKFPADGSTVYLPIDSKFPGDCYAHLVDAYNAADEEQIVACKKLLMNQFKSEAKDIASKYISVPNTTDFGIMFLPFEGLYAEAVNMGVIEILQREYGIIIAGPSTMAALLNSLQMGFRTLAIQENAKKVWEVLCKVKNEFEKYEEALYDAKEKISKAEDSIDKLLSTRTNKMNVALRSVEKLDGFSAIEAPDDSDYYIEGDN